jgi:hypothetical protein
MIKMNPAIKAQWVAALRSGEYAQATGHLRRDAGFCCLGVLTDIAVKAGVGKWVEGRDGGFEYPDGENGVRYTLLPNGVACWAGLPTDDVGCGPTVDIAGFVTQLADHNDSGRTFAQIADAIEAQL